MACERIRHSWHEVRVVQPGYKQYSEMDVNGYLNDYR